MTNRVVFDGLRPSQSFFSRYLAVPLFGRKISKKFCLAFQIATVYCWPGKPDIPQSSESIQTGLYINNQNYVALNIKSMIEIKANWGIQISIGGGLWANNVQQGPSLGLGFYYKSIQN